MIITIGALTLCKGGAQRMLVVLANGLIRSGHDVKIIMPKYGVVEYPLLAPIIRTEEPYTISAASYPKSDIIISNYFSMVPEAEEASLQGKGKHVRISLCYEPTFLPDNDATFMTYNITPNLIVLSNWQKQIIKLNHGIDSVIVPVGVGSEFFNMNTRTSNHPLNISAIIRKPEDGNWHRQQDYLIYVLQLIKNMNPDVNILIITPQNEFETSKKLQHYQQVLPFNFRQPINDQELNILYNQTDIFVNSSIYDTASLPGLEAMKCGAALVTTYNGGNADYAKHNVNSLISYRYENKLVDHIQQLIDKPDLRKSLALAGQREAEKWTWDSSVTALNNYLQNLYTS